MQHCFRNGVSEVKESLDVKLIKVNAFTQLKWMFERQDKLQEHLPSTTVCPKIQNGALVGRVVLPEKRDIGVKIAYSSQRPSNCLLDLR